MGQEERYQKSKSKSKAHLSFTPRLTTNNNNTMMTITTTDNRTNNNNRQKIKYCFLMCACARVGICAGVLLCSALLSLVFASSFLSLSLSFSSAFSSFVRVSLPLPHLLSLPSPFRSPARGRGGGGRWVATGQVVSIQQKDAATLNSTHYSLQKTGPRLQAGVSALTSTFITSSLTSSGFSSVVGTWAVGEETSPFGSAAGVAGAGAGEAGFSSSGVAAC